jgi:hypothetical protein
MGRQQRLVTSASRLLACALIPSAFADAQSTHDSASARLSGNARREVPVGPLASAPGVLVGASVVTLDSTDIAGSVGENLSAVLVARVPGLSVLRPGGSVAEGSRIRQRGPRSFLMASEPIVIVDGIRVNAMQEASVIDVGVRVSRLDDIAPEDIARIDVLPGPAAAALFGPGAAGGALVIRTKRGHIGPARWAARVESRVGLRPSGFPANYRMSGVATATGQPAASCDVLEVASGACTPTTLDVWNPLEQASPFRAARTAAASLSLAGGAQHTAARISATGRRTLGVAAGDDEGRLGLAASAAHRVLDAVQVDLNGGFARTSVGLPLRGDHIADIIGAGMFGSARDDSTRGYRLVGITTDTRQRATHWHAGASVRWRPRSWLTASAIYGRDQLDQRDGYVDSTTGASGFIPSTARGEFTHATTTIGASAVASYSVARSLPIRATTSVGYERLGSANTVSDWRASLENGVPVAEASSWVKRRWVIDGPWLRQQLVWRERVSVGGAVRLERRRAFGPTAESWFKAADASWLVGSIGRVAELRLRAAYGEAGNWMAGNTGSLEAFASSTIDPADLEPVERVAESEVGADARVGDVLTASITAFRADASKLYLLVLLSSGLGFVASPSAVGSMRNEGIEATVGTRLLDFGGLRWEATLTAATLRNRVRSLGGGPPIVGTNTRTDVGYPLGGYWVRPYTYADADGDGTIEPNEIQSSDAAVFVGSSLPTREASLQSALSLAGRLMAKVLFDYRGGHKLANTNERFRCRAYRNCRAAQDPTAPADEQARYAASRAGADVDEFFLEDASFVKLRELSLTWTLPARWAPRVAGGSAAITIAGRNVATWTRYGGLDPELNYRRFVDLPAAELGKSPPLREIVVRMDFK